MRKVLAVCGLLLLVVVASLGAYLFMFGRSKATLREENLVPITPTNIDVVTGKVLVFNMTKETMTIQFIAESTKGNITHMMVWTDANPVKEWQEFSTLLVLPISDNVYVKYRDDMNNESQVYSDSIYPKYGPPTQL